MKRLLKIFNPLIWCLNVFSYAANLHHWAEMEGFERKKGGHYEYEPYDFSKDIKYF